MTEEDFDFAGSVNVDNCIPKVGGKEMEIGTKSDCSTDRGTPFNLVRQAKVVTRWSLGIDKIKKGENVHGESSSPPTCVKGIWKDFVKCEGRLNDGMLVKKHDGVGFTNKDGRFCLALSMAVKTMMKGEKVILTVKPQYGFREKGKSIYNNEGSLPLNPTLQITLELVSWMTVSEVTVDKKVVKEGKACECSNEGAVVKLKLIGKLQDGTDNDGEAELFEFKTNEAKQMMDELDRVVTTMKKGDVALLTIEPEYSFGSSGSRHELDVVPPNSTLYYDVEQVSIVENKGSWDMMSVAEKQVSRKKYDGYYPRFMQAESTYKRIEKVGNSDFYECESDDSKVWLFNRSRDLILNTDPKLYRDQVNLIFEEFFRKLDRIEKENDNDAYANYYQDMFNKMKSWIPTTVIKLGQRMLKQ